jgi:hypothetical protein
MKAISSALGGRLQYLKAIQLATQVESQLRLTVYRIAQLANNLASVNDANHLAIDLRHVQDDIDIARSLTEVLEQHIEELKTTRHSR